MSILRELMLKILLRKEVDVMAVVYATLIIKGRKTITATPIHRGNAVAMNTLME